jgi:hypothetical protein
MILVGILLNYVNAEYNRADFTAVSWTEIVESIRGKE